MAVISPYRFSHTIMYSEVDPRGYLALPSFFSLFQEAALLQAEVMGFGESYCAVRDLDLHRKTLYYTARD